MLRNGLVVSLLITVSPAVAESVTGVPRIVDGDTLEIGVVTVRLHGIDAMIKTGKRTRMTAPKLA